MRNITIKQYVELKDRTEYDILDFLKPTKAFGSYEMSINDMTYTEVKTVAKRLREFKGWDDIVFVFTTCFNITEEQFYNGKILDFFSAKKYVVKYFQDLLQKESKLLSSISIDSAKWIAAGGDKLNRFSDILPINQLGKIYGIYPFELGNYKYFEIITLLTIEKEQNEIERRMHEMK